MQTSDGLNDAQASLEHASLQENDTDATETQAAVDAAAADVQQSSEADLVAKIVRQVNFYFSDTNLPTDNFLLKEVRKTPEGWVPVRLIASFKRMKTLSKDLKVIVAALETSPELLVSGHRVRRKLPLPDVDETEVLLRTAIVDNLPEQATIESLTEKFGVAGKVKMVRICQPNSGPRSIAQSIPGADLAVSRQLHALVEYESQEEVAAAVKQLTDSNNWRSGLRVRPLLRRAFQPPQQQQQSYAKSHGRQQHQQTKQGQGTQHQHAQALQESQGHIQDQTHQQDSQQQQQQQKQQLDGGGQLQHDASQSQTQQNGQSGDGAGQSQTPAVSAQADHAEKHVTQRQGKAGGKGQKSKRTKKDYAAWAGATAETRAVASAQLEGNPDAPQMSVARQLSHAGQPSAPGSTQPKMPDGSHGFSMGRGQPIAAPQPA